MNNFCKWTTYFALATFVSASISKCNGAQTDQASPVFRPRTDANAATDLQRLQDELNKASDAKGAVNPLGNFLQRNSPPARLEISPSADDQEAQQKPTIDSKSSKLDLAPASSIAKPTKGIVMLPGPRYTIIQQASPQIRNAIVDDFRPARSISDLEATVRPTLQYPVTLASADLPIVGQPSRYVANYQDVPFGSFIPPPPNITPVLPPAGNVPLYTQPVPFANPAVPVTNPSVPFTNPPTTFGPSLPATVPGFASNPQPILPDANTAPVLPYSGGPLPNNPITAPIYGTPIQNNNIGTTYNPPPIYQQPTYQQPIYQQPTYQPNLPMATNPGLSGSAPMRSPSDSVMPNLPRSSSVVNGAPFVSSPPCQFDASYIVSRNVYRQSVDPCAQPAGGAPGGYAPSPYATQPAGSPFSYVPPTSMAYNNINKSGYRPLIGFGQSLNKAYLGRGIVGQPIAYVDGQPIRNFVRYLLP